MELHKGIHCLPPLSVTYRVLCHRTGVRQTTPLKGMGRLSQASLFTVMLQQASELEYLFRNCAYFRAVFSTRMAKTKPNSWRSASKRLFTIFIPTINVGFSI